MPNRMLREGILTSEAVNALNWAEEVFYRRLHSVVDDFGRFYATPKLIRAACYPLHIDKVSDSDIGKWLAACETAALVRVYPALDGKRYLEVLNFRQQVRAKTSRFPAFDAQALDPCAADAQQLFADAHLGGVVVVGVDGYAPPQAAAQLDSRGSRLPRDWVLPTEWYDWAQVERPDLDVSAVATDFRDYWVGVAGAKGRKADWEATWRGWVRRQDRKRGGAAANDWTRNAL